MGNDTLTYDASITGWSVDNDSFPRLDSIKFALRGFYTKDREVITIEKITRQKRNKWHISPSIGVGYGVINRKPDIWVGISANYEL